MIRCLKADQHPRQGAFTAAAASKQRHRFTRLDVQADVAQHARMVRVIVADVGNIQ